MESKQKNERRITTTWGKILTLAILIVLFFGAAWLGRGRMDSQTVKRAMAALGFSVTAAQNVAWDEPIPSGTPIQSYTWHSGPSSGNYPSFEDVGNVLEASIPYPTGETRWVAVTAKYVNGMESGPSNEIIIGGGIPPSLSPTPTATATARPSPTPTATSTVPPNAITVIPASLQFVGPNPSPKTIQVITSNGAPWTAFDACTWLDAQPQSGGPSGTFLTVTVTNAQAGIGNPCQERFSAPGLPDKFVTITITANATPTATAIRTPTPRPTATAIKTPTPSPTKTPTPRPTATATASATASATFTPTATATATVIIPPTPTATCWCATPCPPKPQSGTSP